MAKQSITQGHSGSLVNLRKNIDTMFERFARQWPSVSDGWLTGQGEESAWPAAFPSVDVVEKKKELIIKAELPGMDEDNVHVEVSNNMLTIRGEKTQERSEEEDAYHLTERRYGSFRRSFMLPDGIKPDKINAKFRKGVLTVRLPKSTQAQNQSRKIEISSH